ncbi:MAG: serine/threonine-protein kinase, partial [Planctomycetota bacterium]
MGTVYLAEVTKPTAGLAPHARVALKVIHTHLLEQEGYFKRFMREGQVGQRVKHANVVRTHDCDALLVDGEQKHFLVMEYVEGQTLRQLLREMDRVPEELCRHVAREVALGLAAIHDAGVVHRDLKPENVLITEDHVVKVMDLGVARLKHESIRLSRTGVFVGSIEYAAPEQFRGAHDDLDGRTDLHALGVVLFELSTGRHPFRDDDSRKVFRRILEETPRRTGELNPQLSPFFEEAVHRLLAKGRDDRFPSATEFAEVMREGEKSAWWKERAKAHRLETKMPLRRIRIPRETALYGRDPELARLRDLYGRAKDGEGQVLLIEGEAGIGKTRLVDEFVGRLRQDGEELNFLYGSYPPGGAATAAGAFSTAYREQFGEAALEQTLGRYLPETPILIPAFAALLRGDATPTGAEPLTKDSLQTVFVHATRALAAERPTVVLIDDLHFSPEEGRALFALLALALHGHRVLLIGTARPGLSEEWVANLERQEHTTRLDLERLGPKDLVQLLQDAFRSERLAEELAGQIALQSDGNPFFAFEIIRGLREGNFITQKPDGTWISTQVIRDIQIPSAITDLIQARLHDLSESDRELLDVAACCGFEFDPSVVAEAAGVPRVPALRAFGRMEHVNGLVRSAGRRLVFDHHQIQEALYGGTLEQLREAYHAAIAAALEAREHALDRDPKTLDGALCVDLCEHFLKGRKGQPAHRYLDAALDHLEAGYLNDQAIDLIDRALAVGLELAGTERAELLLRKAARLDLLGRRAAQGETLEAVLALPEATEDSDLLIRLRQARSGYFFAVSRPDDGRHELEIAL